MADPKLAYIPLDYPPPATDVQEGASGWWPGRSWTRDNLKQYKLDALMKPNPDREENK